MLNRIWIISDTHFNHRFMVEGGIRPEDYQQQIIDNWKSKVRKTDIIIHLGDVIFDRPSELKGILDDLPGYKILVRGNHDKNTDLWYRTKGFNEVHDTYSITLRNKKTALLSHKPCKTSRDIQISGHLHNYLDNNTFRHKECLLLTNKSRIYSAEIEGYQPIPLEEIASSAHSSCGAIFRMGPTSIRIGYRKEQVRKFLFKERYGIFNNNTSNDKGIT